MRKFSLIFAGALLAVAAFFLFEVQAFYNHINTKKGMFPALLQKAPEKTTYNVLLLGYGGGQHEGTYLTDTIMIAHIDTINKKVVLISLPRDLWIKMPTKSGSDFHVKINSVYELGLYPDNYPDVKTVGKGDQAAGDLAKKTIGDIVGIPIDYYTAVDFAGFVKTVDLLGGVDINVETTFDDYQYPIDGKEKELCGRDDDFKKIEPYLTQNEITLTPDQQDQKDQLFKDHPELEKFFTDITDTPQDAFPCRYEHLHFDRGLQHMDGQTALKYARSRHSAQDGDDFGRAARQQKVIEAIKEKIFTIGFVPKIIPLMDEIKNDIKTDLDLSLIKKYNQETQKKESYVISSAVPNLTLLAISSSPTGGYILVPKEGSDQWNGLKVWVKNVIAGITPTPSPQLTPKKSSP